MHLLLHRVDKRGDFGRRALGFELHPAVGEIAHEAGHLEFLRDLEHRVAETDTLHMAGEKNGFVMHVGHGGRP